MAISATQLAVSTTPSAVIAGASTWVGERGSFNQPQGLTLQNLSTTIPIILSGSSATTGGGYILQPAPNAGSILRLNVFDDVFAVTTAGATATLAVLIG